jgi:tungstate transport system substrate-binding protein
MSRRLRTIGVSLAVAIALAACGSGDDRVVVAAGTTVVDSGVIDALAEAYESTRPGSEVSVVGRATREVLELGSRGAADLLITHAPDQERDFLAANPDSIAEALFSSRFLLVGPAGRTGPLAGLSIAAALQRIALERWDFVTRADGSGTYEREVAFWAEAGVAPLGEPWYIETGQGMGNSLQVADQRESFILVEEGTFLAVSDVLHLHPVDLTGDDLRNPYTVIVPAGDAAAEELLDWLLSTDGRAALAIANNEAFGREVFTPGGS